MPVQDVITDGKVLARKLGERADRSVYEGQDGNFYLDYQGGVVARSAIQEAFKVGLIRLKWPDRPNLHSYVLK